MTLAGRHRRVRTRRLGLGLGLAVLLVAGLAPIALPDHPRGGGHAALQAPLPAWLGPVPAWVKPTQAALSVRTGATGTPVPRSFFGLSTEYWTLPVWERHLHVLARVLALLHVRGGGPMILRVGGDSASHVRWDPRARSMPSWVLRLTPSWLAHTRSLVLRTGVQLVLDLNVATGSPHGAAAWARAAQRALPAHSVVGFEIGNEPDAFDRSFKIGSLSRSGPTTQPISAGRYAQDFSAYARALVRRRHAVPLLGPALASPRRAVGWIPQLLAARGPALAILTAHDYLYSGCARPGATNYPTISKLLAPPATWAQNIRLAAASAHSVGLGFRLTEFNSVDCGGLPGVSNTFATALWAPGALFTLIRDGVDAVNLHARAFPVNAPFVFSANRLQARPLLYGMLLFARALGPHARLVPVNLRAAGSQHLAAWAVRVGAHTLHLVILNDSTRSAVVSMRIPGQGPAVMQRLLAPAVGASTGVTLAGQHITGDGRWAGRFLTTRIRRHAGRYKVTLSGTSAALLTIHVGRR